MRIGIVNMHKDRVDIQSLLAAVRSMDYVPFVLDAVSLSSLELLRAIEHSPIRHWIFSGSRYHIHQEGVPTVPLELLKTEKTTKRFLMICFSMESVLVQLGFPIRERYINRKEFFHLSIPKEYQTHPLFKGIPSSMRGWRDHRFYFPRDVLTPPVYLLSSYNGESMIATYKNAVLIQYHPEKTKDGRQLLENWLSM